MSDDTKAADAAPAATPNVVPSPSPAPPASATPTQPATPAAPKEQVLCFPAQLLDELGPFKWTLKGNRVQKYLDVILDSKNLVYLDREQAEQDMSYRQLIPYVLIKRGNEFFRYQRSQKGGESRLHDLWSVGVGGHINPVDGKPGVEAYEAAFARELAEEVQVGASLITEKVKRPVALICDESEQPSQDNPVPVGKVHLGVVHVLEINFRNSFKTVDPALANGDFQHQLEIKHDLAKYEGWSRMAIRDVIF